MTSDILTQLRFPFHPSAIEFKPGATSKDKTSALGLFYADLRAYQNRLDEICGMDWSVTYTAWGDRIVCHLTISGVTRSSTGEGDAQSERTEIAGTAAEAQAFKRACAMFGLGRYLYDFPAVWAEFDGNKAFTPAGKAKLEKLVFEHYKRAGQPEKATPEPAASQEKPSPAVTKKIQEFSVLGNELYGENWPQVYRKDIQTISQGKETEPTALTVEDLDRLIVRMNKIKQKRAGAAA